MDFEFTNFLYLDLLLMGKRLKMLYQTCKVCSDNLSTNI